MLNHHTTHYYEAINLTVVMTHILRMLKCNANGISIFLKTTVALLLIYNVMKGHEKGCVCSQLALMQETEDRSKQIATTAAQTAQYFVVQVSPELEMSQKRSRKSTHKTLLGCNEIVGEMQIDSLLSCTWGLGFPWGNLLQLTTQESAEREEEIANQTCQQLVKVALLWPSRFTGGTVEVT